MKRTPILGCIADDVTGATDLAINLVQGGMCVVQLLEIPTAHELEAIDADAIVVGLKTRSIPKDHAVTKSIQTLNAFRSFGIERFFFKYCSTFDSTTEGNIGPVAAGLLDELGTRQTIFCPAFPRMGRTVYQGHLFVKGKLLNESGMEQHPLNPMTDPNLVRFLAKQCDRRIGLLEFEHVEGLAAKGRLDELLEQDCQFVIVDACNDAHLETIAAAVADMPLVTGGSGIARFLPDVYREFGLLSSPRYTAQMPQVSGRSLIIAGSCSIATNNQVAWMCEKIPSCRIPIDEVIANSRDALRSIIEWAVHSDATQPLLIYSTVPADQVADIQSKHGAEAAARALEDFLSTATAQLVSELDISRLIIAGGETAGAVVNKLGVSALRIGPEICPGVPWTETVGERPMALALKSGNFGQADFFEQALSLLP